jgi:HEAT repeat protein
MLTKVLLAHAVDEEEWARKIADPLRDAGFDVWDQSDVLIGDSLVEEASKRMSAGGAVVVCATVRAVGTKWGRKFISAARQYPACKLFIMQMEAEADIDSISFADTVGRYWENPTKAMADLVTALKELTACMISDVGGNVFNIESRYAEILLKTCDIIDLANLPETDRNRAIRQLELRKLYVALRVISEVSSTEEPNLSDFADIELRRDLLRRGRKNWSDLSKDLIGLRKNSVGEILATNKFLVVLGDPGSGKTTLLRWISTAYLLRLKNDADWGDLPDVASLPTEDWLPIMIRCRDFNQHSTPASLEELLHIGIKRAEITDRDAALLVPTLIQKLRDGKAILLIDGVDEITDLTLRISFCDQIEQMHLAYPKASLVITSRIVGYREMGQRIGRGFEHVTVAELSKEDKDEFARLWCSLTEIPERRADATAELVHAIHSTDRIERLTSNPMLLTTVSLVKRKVGRLPRHRVDLYGDALAVLLNWRREVDEPIDWNEAVPQLGYLAYGMCDRGVLQLREDEIIELLEWVRKDYPARYAIHAHTPDQFLRLLERHTGVLTQVGSTRHLAITTPVYEFRHLTFQEYLAALSLIKGCYPGRDRSKTLGEAIAPLAGRLADEKEDDAKEPSVSENWLETLRLCVAACPPDDVDSVLQAILHPLPNEEHNLTGRPRAVLASLCLADDPDVTVDVVNEIIHALVAQIDVRDDTENQKTGIEAAVKELSTSRWAKILKSTLVESFCQQDYPFRASIIRLYGIVVSSLEPLDDEAQRSDWIAKQKASLFPASTLNAVEIILTIHSLASRYDVFIPKVLTDKLISLLSEIQPLAIAAALVLDVLNRNNRRTSAWLPRGSELAKLLLIIEDPTSAPEVVEALLRIVGREKYIPALAVALSKLDEKRLRDRAVTTLGQLGETRAASDLIARLNDRDMEFRVGLINALAALHAENAAESILPELNSDNASLRRAAALALGKLRVSNASELLMNRLHDTNADVRLAVLKAIQSIENGNYKDLYIASLDDASEPIRDQAARYLIGTGDPEAVEILLAKLQDPDDNIKLGVTMALGESNDSRVVEPLINQLESGNEKLFATTALSLGLLHDTRAIPTLLKCLDSPEFPKQVLASLALGLIGDDQVVDPLLAKLNNRKEKDLTVFIFPLAKFKQSRIVDAFLDLIKTNNRRERAAVIEALGNMEEPRIVEALLMANQDNDSRVRASAISALANFKDDRILPVLTDGLTDPTVSVRAASAKGLESFRDPSSLDHLIKALDDDAAVVREAAVDAIGAIGDPRAVQLLINKLKDESNSVRIAIVTSLKDLKDTIAVEPLLYELQNGNSAIRSLAHSALYSIALDQFNQGNIEFTIKVFSAMVLIEPDDNLHNNIAFCFMLKGEYGAASKELGFVDFLEPSGYRPLFQNNLGLLSFLCGETDQAINQLQQAMIWSDELGPNADHEVSAVLILRTPNSVSSHIGVPVDVALVINLYLIMGSTHDEATEELRRLHPKDHEHWIELMDTVASQYFASDHN